MKMNAYRLIADCLQWEAVVAGGTPVPEKFIDMSQAMLRVARYIRTGALTND